MRKLIVLCAVALMAILLLALLVSCQQPQPVVPTTTPSSVPLPKLTTTIEIGYYQETTLEEASNILGVTIPAPTYLPKGLKVQEVYISFHPEGGSFRVILLISEEEIEKKLVTYTDQQGVTRQRYEFESEMEMSIRPAGPGLKMPWAERVKIGGISGNLVEGDDYNSLWWQMGAISNGRAGSFKIVLSASKGIPKEELMKVAESVLPTVFPLEIQVALDKSTYLLGEEVRIEFSLQNVGPRPLEIEPFPPAVEIRHREPYDEPPKTVCSIPAEIGATSLEPGEMVSHTLIWQQHDDQGQPVPYGYYYITLEDIHFGKGKVSILDLRRQKLELLMLPPEGLIEKTIEVNESQTVNDITITLERVELSTSAVTFYAVCVPPDYTPPENPLLLPLHLVKPAWAEYRLDDSAVKNAGKSGGLHLKDGIRYTWGKLDPVPNGTKKLTFTIVQVGRWEGPWEFHVSLE